MVAADTSSTMKGQGGSEASSSWEDVLQVEDEGRYAGVMVEMVVSGRQDLGQCKRLYVDPEEEEEEEEAGCSTRGDGVDVERDVAGGLSVDMSSNGMYAPGGRMPVAWEIDGRVDGRRIMLQIPVDIAMSDGVQGTVLERFDMIFPGELYPMCVCRQGMHSFETIALSKEGSLYVVDLMYESLQKEHELRRRDFLSVNASIKVIQLESSFAKHGGPSSLTCLRSHVVCIGTDNGAVICCNLLDSSPRENTFELVATSGILGSFSSYLGGFFGSNGTVSGISHAFGVEGDEGKSILCCMHDDCTLRIWDTKSRCIIHSVALVPPDDAQLHKPVCATCESE